MSPWRLEARLSELFSAEVEKLRRTKNACLEEAVALWLASRGVEGVAVPAGCALGSAKPAVDAEEKARQKAEQEAAAAREKLVWSWKRNAEYNEHCKKQGIMPLWREHYLPTNAEEQAEEDARKAAEKAAKEGAFV
jgi:hypothetical protein